MAKKQTTITDIKTLGEFIKWQADRRKKSLRAFALECEIEITIMSKFRWHGIKDEYGGKPIGDPALDFILALAKATGTDACTVLALTARDKLDIDPEARLLAQTIAELPSETRKLVKDIIINRTYAP